MYRFLATALFLWISSAGLSHAQWQTELTTNRFEAFVENRDGTRLAFYCTSEAADREKMLIDLNARLIVAETDDEEIARFEVGTWTFTVEVFPQRRLTGNLHRYNSRVDFYDEIPRGMRTELASGSVVRFEETFDFAAMQFGLRGSGAAIRQLETECPRLWTRSQTRPAAVPIAQPEPAPQTQPAPQPFRRDWSHRLFPDGVRAASIVVRDGASLMLSCNPDQTMVWTMAVSGGLDPLRGEDGAAILLVDGYGLGFDVRGSSGLSTGGTAYILEVDLERQGVLMAAIADGDVSIVVPDPQAQPMVTFPLGANTSAVDRVLAACNQPSLDTFSRRFIYEDPGRPPVNTWRDFNGAAPTIGMTMPSGSWISLMCRGAGDVVMVASFVAGEGRAVDALPDRLNGVQVALGSSTYLMPPGQVRPSGSPSSRAYAFEVTPEFALSLQQHFRQGTETAITPPPVARAETFYTLAGAGLVGDMLADCLAATPAAVPDVAAPVAPEAPAVATPTVPEPGTDVAWSVEVDDGFVTARAIGAPNTYFGLQCQIGRADQVYWTYQIPQANSGVVSNSAQISVGDQTFSPLGTTAAAMQQVDGFMPFYAGFQPVGHAGLLVALRSGGPQMRVEATTTSQAATFELSGFNAAFNTVIAQCGYDPTALPGQVTLDASPTAPVAPPPTSAPSPTPISTSSPSLPSDAIDSLRAFIASEVGAECASLATLEMADEMFTVDGLQIQVDLGFAQCDWRFINNPFCGARLCELRTYDYRDGGFTLTSSILR